MSRIGRRQPIQAKRIRVFGGAPSVAGNRLKINASGTWVAKPLKLWTSTLALDTPVVFSHNASGVSAVTNHINHTLPTIATVAVGILMVVTNTNADTATTPSGWTLVNNMAPGSTLNTYCFYKVLSSSDSGLTVTSTWSGNGKLSSGLIVLTGVDTLLNPASATTTNTTTTTLQFPPITPDVTNMMLIRLAAHQHPTSGGIATYSTGYTKQEDVFATTALPVTGVSIGTKQLSGQNGVSQSGADATFNTASRFASLTLGVRPATIGSSGRVAKPIKIYKAGAWV